MAKKVKPARKQNCVHKNLWIKSFGGCSDLGPVNHPAAVCDIGFVHRKTKQELHADVTFERYHGATALPRCISSPAALRRRSGVYNVRIEKPQGR